MYDALDPTVAAVASPAAAVEGADVVITATSAIDPVFDGDLLEPGTHVTAMGQYHPEKRELDETTVERATYVPDLRERATMDAGSFLAAVEAGVVDEDHVHAELGEVVAGDASGRSLPRRLQLLRRHSHRNRAAGHCCTNGRRQTVAARRSTSRPRAKP